MNWKRKDMPTIMSGIVVRYQLDDGYYSGEVSVSREGVAISGVWPTMCLEADLEEMKAVMELARHQYAHIVKSQKARPFDDDLVILRTKIGSFAIRKVEASSV
jgi:hypothetical protein